MVTLILMLKRKPGLSAEEFRHHYETSHAILARKHFGHLFHDYRRHYVRSTRGVRNPENGSVFGVDPGELYDAITKIDFVDQAALDEFNRIAAEPAVRAELVQDEARFLDREAIRVSVCEEVKTWTAADAAGG